MEVLSPRLPPELTDKVIAHVGDPGTLFSCCLVCTDWLPASRHHLFGHIRIENRRTYDLLVSRVLHSDQPLPRLSSVFELTLGPFEPFLKSMEDDLKIGLFVQEFAGYLPRLTRLTVNNTTGRGSPPHPSAFAAFSRFPSLRELTLRSCHFHSSSALRRALAALPSLITLDLCEVTWPQPRVQPPFLLQGDHRGPIRMALSSLRLAWELCPKLHGRCAQHFLTWLSATPTPSSLRELVLNRSGSSPAIAHGYMHVLGPALPRFVRFVSTLRMYALVSGNIGLQRPIRAVLKRISIILVIESYRASDEWARLPAILHALPVPAQLESIVIDVFGPLLDHRIHEGMDVLDSLLEGDTFKEVKSLILTLHYKDPRNPPPEASSLEEAKATVRGKLPRLLLHPVVKLDFTASYDYSEFAT
ncbi:hypothetical protein L227DRAFT_94648 [Lentinus tigrinus ALCF2SS1-6]|uniref:F-box domain-containing protein n=1 Tax=Lentinus tigrinus ALCF2SS1-6 TaxID=1328759 RepID=A0A5C2SH71_9APHY|nr:hypothetical protein L227DRAFT_94648 [Lentinus tigrinus ALCF2SS1-6]